MRAKSFTPCVQEGVSVSRPAKDFTPGNYGSKNTRIEASVGWVINKRIINQTQYFSRTGYQRPIRLKYLLYKFRKPAAQPN